MRIDTSHGVIAGLNPDLFVHRNCLDIDQFEAYLKACPRYCSLKDCLAGRGNAFTLDDSMVIAGDAARLARKYGHEVTIFLNGYNIEYSQPYFFSKLNVVLDETKLKNVRYLEIDFPIETMQQKERFRYFIKRHLAKMGSEEDRQEFVSAIGRLLGITNIVVPPPLRPLSRQDVCELIALGVSIENHGWSHVRVGALPDAAHDEDIRRGRQWLLNNFGIDAAYYAVPNGDGLPPSASSTSYDGWFLLDAKVTPDRFSPKLFNRSTLNL
jgi:hypothetical protein